MRKLVGFILLILLILCSVSLANPNYANWGFAGYSYGLYLVPRTLWGAQAYDGTIPQAYQNRTFSNYRLPIITNLDKTVSLGISNEIYLLSSSQIGIFNNEFSQVGSYNLLGWNGSVSVVNIPSSSKYYLAYMSKSGSNWSLSIINRTGFSFSNVKTIDISDRSYTGDIKGGLDTFAYLPDMSYNITRVNLIDGTETLYPAWQSNMTKRSINFMPNNNNDFEVNDYNVDGVDDILIVAGREGSNAQAYIGVLDTSIGAWTTQITTPSTSFTDGMSIATGTLGTSGSGFKIFAFFRGTSGRTLIYDFGGNLLRDSGTIYQYNYPVLADINEDGANEYLELDSSGNMKVYDDAFNLLTTINSARTRSSETEMVLYGVGRYLDNSTWLDIVSTQGILQVNSTQTGVITGNKIGKTTSDSFGMIPVSIRNQNVKDIIFINPQTNPTTAYFSNLAGAVCGNGICEVGETALTCPEDCAPTEPTGAVITSVEINPCNTVTWKKNTTVQVSVTAQNINLDPVNIFVSFAGNSLLGGCAQYSNQTGVISGSNVKFNFVANCTGTSDIIISANTDAVPDENTLGFSFSVADDGISFGDSVCGINQPLSQVLPPANTTTDINENGLTQAMRSFSSWTKLGMNILTFVILLAFTIGLFVFGAKYSWNQNLIGMIILLVDTFIVLIAVNLGWINVGIVITLVVAGFIGIGLWLFRLFHPSQ